MKGSSDPFAHLRKGYEEAAEFYNLFASNEDIPLYLEYAEKLGSPILDLASGAGRVAIALSKAGYDVYGIESSEAMLNVARKYLGALPEIEADRISLIEGDMRNFELGIEFPLILIPSSFGHALTTAEQLSVLGCVHRHLQDNGLFILDLFPGGALVDHGTFEDPPARMSDGRVVTRFGEMRVDSVNQIIELKLRFTIEYPEQSGKETDKIELLSGASVLYNHEADSLLKTAGFEVLEEFGDFDKRPYTSECARRILILAKGEVG
ncbi:MAG: methyltransferase domain-containing protein [Candidatus Thorarchaeota archaeon]|nr:MAG: methyltransferase domain-containing protein [Candidatus Thorarchaeota archaeon]